MSTFDDPFNSDRRLVRSGCACGLHRNEAEHDHAARLQCAAVEDTRSAEQRHAGVVAWAVMCALFPDDVGRRAFLKSLGASTARAAMSRFPG